jgi:4-aminobutyrate aminotransferase-like enzyme
VPDLLILGKSVGGSLAAAGVTLTTRRIQKAAYGSMRRFDLHGSTFAGNAFASVAALETLRILQDEHLVTRSRETGAAMLAGLRDLLRGHPLVADIRGRGLLIAIEVQTPGAPKAATLAGQWLALALLEEGLIVQPASQAWNVLRIEPPLTIDALQISTALDGIGRVFDRHRSTVPLLGRSARRIVEQLLARGRFR